MLQMFTVLLCKAPSPSLPQVDVDGECGAELTTLKLSWFNPVNDGEYEALMAFNVVSVSCCTLLILHLRFQLSLHSTD